MFPTPNTQSPSGRPHQSGIKHKAAERGLEMGASSGRPKPEPGAEVAIGWVYRVDPYGDVPLKLADIGS